MMNPACALLAAALLAVPPAAFAATVPVTSGTVVVDFDPVALGQLNYGSDPAIPALILEEFFRGDQDRTRTYNQILTDQIVPDFTAIPTTCLKFEINGPTVVNPTGRRFKPSTFTYDPANVTGTATGEIGLTGTTRYIGDFTGGFVLGDFDIRYNLAPATYLFPNRGWVFVNNYSFAGVPAFETASVTVSATAGKLVVAGDLTVSYELDLYFFPGDRGKKIGTFRMETPSGPASLPRQPLLTRLPGGAMEVAVTGKGNTCYQLQYSADLLHWTTTGPRYNGTEQILRWTDAGPPLTPAPPSSTPLRFYRLIED